MASVFVTVFETAREVALGDPLQYTAATIGGANSAAISGSGKKRRRVRLLADADCWVAWGENPTATGSADSVALVADQAEYWR